MSGAHTNKGNEAVLALKLAAGIQQHFAATSQLYIAEKAFTPAQVAAQLQALATLRTAVETARAALQGKLEDEKQEGPTLRAFYLSVIGFVRVAYATAPEILADFGLAPTKARTPLTADQLAAAVVKRQATRAARGTMGKKQKLAIKGKVTGVVVTPITSAPAAPVTTAASGPSGPGTGGAASAPAVVNGAAH